VPLEVAWARSSAQASRALVDHQRRLAAAPSAGTTGPPARARAPGCSSVAPMPGGRCSQAVAAQACSRAAAAGSRGPTRGFQPATSCWSVTSCWRSPPRCSHPLQNRQGIRAPRGPSTTPPQRPRRQLFEAAPAQRQRAILKAGCRWGRPCGVGFHQHQLGAGRQHTPTVQPAAAASLPGQVALASAVSIRERRELPISCEEVVLASVDPVQASLSHWATGPRAGPVKVSPSDGPWRIAMAADAQAARLRRHRARVCNARSHVAGEGTAAPAAFAGAVAAQQERARQSLAGENEASLSSAWVQADRSLPLLRWPARESRAAPCWWWADGPGRPGRGAMRRDNLSCFPDHPPR